MSALITIPYPTDTECPICCLNPFNDPTISIHTWNGHSVTGGAGTESERKIIHGICAKCMPIVPRDEQLSRCFQCRMLFVDNRRSEIVVRRDGILVSETLLPPMQYLKPIRNGEARDDNLAEVFPRNPALFFAIAAASSIGYFAARYITSSTPREVFFIVDPPLSVRVIEVWTPTMIAAIFAQPVLGALSIGAVVLGVISYLGDVALRGRRGQIVQLPL